MKVSKQDSGLSVRWGIVRSFILSLVRFYRRHISVSLGSQCRYYPSCSAYALVSFTFLPMYKAIFFSAKRILSCNQFFPGGVDMPPGLPEKEVMQFLDKNS